MITESELVNLAKGLKAYLGEAPDPTRPGMAPNGLPGIYDLQVALNKAGAKLKTDGVTGPATKAAQAQFPNVTGQTDAEKKAAADANTVNATPTTTTYDDGSTLSTGANGTVSSTDNTGAAYKAGSNPALPQNAPPPPNPYANDPKQAAIYAAMSPADQQWATKGGGKPDLTDPYIAARAPTATAHAPVATAPAPAPTTPSPFAEDEFDEPAVASAPVQTAEPSSKKAEDILAMIRARQTAK